MDTAACPSLTITAMCPYGPCMYGRFKATADAERFCGSRLRQRQSDCPSWHVYTAHLSVAINNAYISDSQSRLVQTAGIQMLLEAWLHF